MAKQASSGSGLKANGKGCSSYGGHKIKGHQIRGRRRTIRRIRMERVLMGHAHFTPDGRFVEHSQEDRWRP